jgi:hypothetical protein
MEKYDCTNDVMAHRERVAYWLKWIIECLEYRAAHHDESKLQPPAPNASRSAAKMQKFRITIARILTYSPAKTFTVAATDIVSAQVRVLRKVHKWYHIVRAETEEERAGMDELERAARDVYQYAKIAVNQIICLGGEITCQPCENREKLAIALEELERVLSGLAPRTADD